MHDVQQSGADLSALCELCFVRPCVVTRVQIEGVGFCRTRSNTLQVSLLSQDIPL